MDSLWNEKEAEVYLDDPLQLRVYTSQLLGREPALVLHGGGNTSVKMKVSNLFGDMETILYVKGSGFDLATIDESGFSPVKLDVLKRMAELNELSDEEMVNTQRVSMKTADAPNPSVEAILHAIIPFNYVDHTHADAVLTICNTDQGKNRIHEIYGDQVLVVPYVMPGFQLAKKIVEMTQNLDWSQVKGVILMNHGVFTFHDDARESYENMIFLASEAEAYLFQQGAWDVPVVESSPMDFTEDDLIQLATLRKAVSNENGQAVIAKWDKSREAYGFANLNNIDSIACRGPMTPDHVIRTRRIPLLLGANPVDDVKKYRQEYQEYFQNYSNGMDVSFNFSPKWAIWPQHGVVTFGANMKEINMISDIVNHTQVAIQRAETLGRWKTLPENEIFRVESWDLEQAKLKKEESSLELKGKVALVTGAASGIGKACAELLHSQGAAVLALDINPEIVKLFDQPDLMGLACDLTRQADIVNAVQSIVYHFGGLDILISNAGTFPPSQSIEAMDPERWDQSMTINLSSHQRLLQACVPYLKQGIDPSVVIIASKNVPAPGPGASAYSVAKAGLTQLARVAALELASDGIRVNVMHPNAVFDTAIWTDEVLEKRAAHYKMSVEEYKTNNMMKVEITSKDVATLAYAMVGAPFSKTTGSQVPIDGGNERVI